MAASSFSSIDLLAPALEGYSLLDSGNGQKLERFGEIILNRPALSAIWEPEHPDLWSQADGTFSRGKKGDGEWTWSSKPPRTWTLDADGLSVTIKPTAFGHLGFFPEHTSQWKWLKQRITPGIDVMNLFAYTGPTSLAAASAGAKVCHVDAVKDINDWARENAKSSKLDEKPIRWLVDDVLKFCQREVRRGNHYHGFILDPPTFGRGPKSEKWVLDDHLVPLIKELQVLGKGIADFVLLTCHTPGISAPVLVNILRPWTSAFGGSIQAGHMLLGASDKAHLPSGVYARWQKDTPNDN